jgi:hypothetical protein
MRETQLDSNATSGASRKHRRPAPIIAAGVIALAIASAVVLEQRGGAASPGTDPTNSSVVTLSAAPSADQSTTSDAPRPHFQRSNEPAVEESVNTYGG